MKLVATLTSIVLFSFFSTTVAADGHDHNYNQISLSATAAVEVDNDLLVAMLVVQENGHKAAELADRVNKKMAQVLAKAKSYKTVDSHTTRYNSQPQYKGGKINGWQVSQHIKLTSQDFDQLSQLVSEVNQLARVQSMTFKVSDQRLAQTKKELTKTAIANFRSKAVLIAEQFDRKHYKLVHINVDGNHSTPRPVMERSMMMAADSARSVPPAVAAGSNKVTVNISGTIELEAEQP